MGKLKSALRKLDPIRVQMAQRTSRVKHELAMKMVAERVKVDAEFAADVLRVAGDTLREEIKKDAHATIARANADTNGHGLIMDKSTIPADMKAVPVDVPISVVDVPQEELVATIVKASPQ